MITELNTSLLVAAGVDPLSAKEIAGAMTSSGMVRLGSVSAGEYSENIAIIYKSNLGVARRARIEYKGVAVVALAPACILDKRSWLTLKIRGICIVGGVNLRKYAYGMSESVPFDHADPLPEYAAAPDNRFGKSVLDAWEKKVVIDPRYLPEDVKDDMDLLVHVGFAAYEGGPGLPYGESPYIEKSKGMFVISQVVGLDV